MTSSCMRKLLALFLTSSFLFAAPVEKAAKYHTLLLKNADSEMLMTRFLEAWLDEQDREALEKWLEAGAQKGGAAERRIWARYLDRIGAHERALEQYQSVLKLEPKDAETGLAVAQLHASNLDFERALQTLGAREDVAAVTLRGSYEHRLGNTKVALDLWRSLLERKPSDRELREDLVSLFRQEGLGKEAQDLQHELMALGTDPFQRALDQLDLGDLELESGLTEAARASYGKVLAASGSGSWMEREALHKLRETFRRERDAEGLRSFLAKLREEMPHRLTLQKSFARQLVITDEVDEGMATFREILRRSPGDETLRLEFVELLAFAERFEEAADELEALIAREATAERWLRLAELRQKFAQEKVLATLGEVEALKNGKAAGVLEMARIYTRFDFADEGLRVLELGHREDAGSRAISDALAVLLVEQEREDEALAVWQTMAKTGGIKEVLRVAQSLRRHGLGEEAFGLLAGDRQAIEGNFGGLRLYCELALELGKIEPAWTGVRQLLALPETFSDFQVAVNLGSAIGRKLGLEKAISALEGADEGNALCLLATLHQLAGRLEEADAVLARAGGELAQRYRVVLLTRRGDYRGAVAQLRAMMSKRASLVLRRELVDLLEQQGDHAGALAEVEEWKISSPGEVQAWKKRAALLVQLGRQAEAADELRRARNTFGRDDVELTRELARMQLPLGKHREALRLYDHLFRTAETDKARLGLVDEMFAAASQVNLQNEIIARFEEEHARAKRELFPLRLLSRLYELSRDPGARQEVLLKLQRLQPNDEQVLFELVALAEQNNDPAGARQLLLDHAALTRSPGTLQRIAAMQIKAGEVEAGLKTLSEIAAADLPPRDLEATAVQLWQLGEHQLVLEFLKKNEAAVSADWRLRSLRSDFLAMVGRVDEAREIWIELLGVEDGLGPPAPVAQRGHSSNIYHHPSGYRALRFPAAGKMNQNDWWQLIRVSSPPFADRTQTNRALVLNTLPKDANEVRWLSLARLAGDHLRTDPTGESWQEFLGTLSHPWLAEVREWELFPKKEFGPLSVEIKRTIEMTPEMRLRKLIGEAETPSEEFLKLATELEDEKPGLAMTCRIHAAFKLPEGAGKLAALRAVAARIAEGDQGLNSNAILFARLAKPQPSFSLLPSPQKGRISQAERDKLKQLEPWWQSRIEHALTGNPTSAEELLVPLALQQLSGDLPEFFENLNRLLGAQLVTRAMRGQPTRRYSKPLEGLPAGNSLIHQLAAQDVIYSLVDRERQRQLISPELLEKAREQGWEPEGHEQLAEFAKQIPQVKDGILRALLFQKIGLLEEFLAEMDTRGEKGNLEEKLDALAFRQAPAQRSENEVLLGALLAMDRGELSPAERGLLDAVTLGEARKNRQLQKIDDEKREALGKIFWRFVASPAGRSKTQTLHSLYRPLGLEPPAPRPRKTGRPTRQRQSYLQLLGATGGESSRRRESEQERTERNFQNQLSSAFSRRDPLGYLRQILGEDRYLGLKPKALAAYAPGDSRSFRKRIRYAQLCLACDELEKAQEMIARLLEERPYDSELEFLLLLAQESDERAAKLDEISRTQNITAVIDSLMSLARVTDEEDPFFNAYERLVLLMKDRADEFRREDANSIFQTFKRFQSMTKGFGKRSLRPMNSRLPAVAQGEDSKEGDWALRTRQRKIIIEACGEMIRFRSIRGLVLAHLQSNKEALRLDDGNVEWIVFHALEKEPVTELEPGPAGRQRALLPSHLPYPSGARNRPDNLALKAILDSEEFSKESVDHLVRHLFLNELQGSLVKAALEGDAAGIGSVMAKYQEKKETRSPDLLMQQALRTISSINSPAQWTSLLETMLRSDRWEKPVPKTLVKAMAASKSQQELNQSEVMRVCELGTLEESLAALEAAAAVYFPKPAMHESYEELKAVAAVPLEVGKKITAGQSLFTSLQRVPRAWIPLLTFMKKSDLAVWVPLDETQIRSQLQQRLDVMYKRVLYDRLRTEGFDSYDGLALLGAERVTDSGELSSWLEKLFSPLKLSPTEGRTYWINVSGDCQEQVGQITYLEAFIAMRKDFKIDVEGRQKVLRSVLESELEKLSGLNEDQLKGLANLVKRDFPKLQVPGASGELEGFLKRLRNFAPKDFVASVTKMMASDKGLTTLNDGEAKGLCARLGAEGGVALAAEFWVAYLRTKGGDRRRADFRSLNFNLLARKPFMGTLDVVDSVRFVRLVREALQDTPEMAQSITYTRDMLEWREAFRPYSSRGTDPAGVIPFLDEMLKREGVTETDKKVIGGFLIKMNLSGRSDQISNELFRLQLKKSPLADHSPRIVETMLALSQLQEGTREKEEDAKAFELLYRDLRDQELMPDFRADLAAEVIAKFNRNEALLELADGEPIAVALRDLLMRGSYGMTGNLHTAGPMMHFVNQHLATVPADLQQEIYGAWTATLKGNAREVLAKRVGQNQKLRLLDILFDFMDGGRRFPLPQRLRDELALGYSGDLELMQKLIRAGNGELATRLLPPANKGFRLNGGKYSAATRILENELMAELPDDYQLILKCYLATLGDANDWKAGKESVGHLQPDRALAAARLFVVDPPDEQAVRLRAINHLERSVETLIVLMPLFADELKDDLPALANNHRGELRYMLRWVEAGGAKTVQSFAPTPAQPIRMYGIREYDEALAELEKLLAPSLNALEKMRFTCDLALLPDPREKDEKAHAFPTRNIRMKQAARSILENPLPEADREAEKKCIAQLLQAGLAEAEAQALLQRDLLNLKKLDVAMLASLPAVDIDLLAFQLRAAITKGDTAVAINCLQVLTDTDSEVPEGFRERLINLILPKITLPLMLHATRQEAGEAGDQILTELKVLGSKCFVMTFSGRGRISLQSQQATLFLTFATHCLTGDKKGYEALRETLSDDGRRRLSELFRPRRSLSYSNISGFSGPGSSHILPAAQPLYFDGTTFHSDNLKPLRKLLAERIQKDSFTGLPAGAHDPGIIALMHGLHLSAADLDLGEDFLASERGNFNSITSAILADDKALFLALLPTAAELYYQDLPPLIKKNYYQKRQSIDGLRRRLQRHWIENDPAGLRDLIEDRFQRLHFEIYLRSFMKLHYADGTIDDLKTWATGREDEILKLLPESGPARAQILARLGSFVRPGSRLAEVLVAQAGAVGFVLKETPESPHTLTKDERLETFLFAWICALHAGDWSVLDRHLQPGADEPMAEFLMRCACLQALHQVAGNPELGGEVLKKLSGYGVKKTNSNTRAWLEIISLVAGAKTSRWKDEWQTLEAEQKKLAQAEMASALTEVLGLLARVELPKNHSLMSTQSWHSELMKIWGHPLARKQSTQLLKTVMEDDLGLFSAVHISAEERARLMLKIIEWQQMKTCIENRFEGEVKMGLLTKLALEGQSLAASQDDFEAFIGLIATQITPASVDRSKLWLKVTYHRISQGDLEGAKSARDQINPAHLKDHELRGMTYSLDRLKAANQ